MDINKISVSRIQVWDTCTQQYKYKYVLKVDPGLAEPFYFIYGSIIHKIAEEYVLHKNNKSVELISEEVLTGKIPYDRTKEGEDVFAPPLPPEYQKRFPKHIKNLQSLTEKLGYEGELEWQFNHELGETPDGKMRIVTGFLDRLIRSGDRFFIIDYKTTENSRNFKNKGNVTKDLQLLCYSMIVRDTFGVPAENIHAALYYLETGKLIGSTFSEESLDQCKDHIVGIYDEIYNTPEDKAWGNVGQWCRRCDYRKICPFYRLT